MALVSLLACMQCASDGCKRRWLGLSCLVLAALSSVSLRAWTARACVAALSLQRPVRVSCRQACPYRSVPSGSADAFPAPCPSLCVTALADHFERPARIIVLYEQFQQDGLAGRSHLLVARPVSAARDAVQLPRSRPDEAAPFYGSPASLPCATLTSCWAAENNQ